MDGDGESKTYEQAIEECREKKSADERVLQALAFMKNALANTKKANFQDFWQMKKFCLESFKGEIHPTQRSALWQEYTNLLAEAHALQKFLDGEMEFEIEQIERAVQAIKKDYRELVEEKADQRILALLHDPEMAKLQTRAAQIAPLKQRVIQLRKEIIALEIRVSKKNRLLKELAVVADLIFPESKELMVQMTKAFEEKLEDFIAASFDLAGGKVKKGKKLHELRKQVKDYQGALKVLFVQNNLYKKAREILSRSWECLENEQKELQKHYEETFEERKKKFEELKSALEKIEMGAQFFEESRKILKQAREAEIGRDFFAELQKISGEKQSIYDEQREKQRAEEARIKQEKREENELRKSEMIEMLKSLSAKAGRMKIENLQEQLEQAEKQTERLQGEAHQERRVFHELSKVRWAIFKKRLGQDIVAEEIYTGTDFLRSNVKNHVKELKREIPYCGLDIEKVWLLEEMIEESRMLIQEIETFLAKVEE